MMWQTLVPTHRFDVRSWVMIDFPNPAYADEIGLVCVGGDLEVETLLAAYTQGIFPWPHPGYPLLWFSPGERGIIRFNKLHVAQSLKKFIRKCNYRLTFDLAFAEVMNQCSLVPRPGQDGTWITEAIKEAYLNFHRKGYAHSVECWDKDELVGGLYGVWVGGTFVGESMFYKKDNASKLCLLHIISFLKTKGIKWMDVQMVTPVIEALGGEYVPRKEFLKLWHQALQENPFESISHWHQN